jgi:hypothetical protein
MGLLGVCALDIIDHRWNFFALKLRSPIWNIKKTFEEVGEKQQI